MKTATKLQNAINSVNRRYARGLNDDDQVAKMCKIAKTTLGYTFSPRYDTYELVTDKERLIEIVEQYGYPSPEATRFNDDLIKKGGLNYMTNLNSSLKNEAQEQFELF